MEKDLITRLPILVYKPNEDVERKSKFKECSRYKLKYLCQLAVNDLIEMDNANEILQVSDYNIMFNLK